MKPKAISGKGCKFLPQDPKITAHAEYLKECLRPPDLPTLDVVLGLVAQSLKDAGMQDAADCVLASRMKFIKEWIDAQRKFAAGETPPLTRWAHDA